MTERQAEQATQEQVRALVMAGVRAGADLRPAVLTAPPEASMRQISVVVHLDLPGSDWPDDYTIAREIAEVLEKGGFVVADSEPCPPLRIVPVIGEAT